MLCFENILKTLGSPNNVRETVLILLKVETFGARDVGLGSRSLRSLAGSPSGTPRGALHVAFSWVSVLLEHVGLVPCPHLWDLQSKT